MKYQQLDNLEAGWKWQYLYKKHLAGERVTRYIDSSEISFYIESLIKIEHQPTLVLAWIDQHLNPELNNKLKQAIRAKRKRHFNAEQEHTKKKSIDLDYRVWERLSEKANSLDSTLSDTIDYLLSELNHSIDQDYDNELN
ncbi:macrodomain Ter protein MatP [Vibrio sp. SS-MA-C1-2]|uniref:macrodomain Ter protein MatP n=1 Tax=Vibrio sp. SS-MA-C1-2 TaxID=2908646 RepID=UPI001F189FA0|nr:macrodomain Ter protein MatP [Vibrio sp. SS-MA-C1-2]UJF18099.1 macrodomain Ter protein MatP [Vibrio sp. SS-MA-C1-2]